MNLKQHDLWPLHLTHPTHFLLLPPCFKMFAQIIRQQLVCIAHTQVFLQWFSMHDAYMIDPRKKNGFISFFVFARQESELKELLFKKTRVSETGKVGVMHAAHGNIETYAMWWNTITLTLNSLWLGTKKKKERKSSSFQENCFGVISFVYFTKGNTIYLSLWQWKQLFCICLFHIYIPVSE